VKRIFREETTPRGVEISRVVQVDNAYQEVNAESILILSYSGYFG
jgi:hypothetical protein